MLSGGYRRYLIGLAVGIVLLGACIGLGGCGDQGSSSTGIAASWAVGYHDLASLKKASDVAVAGSIAGIAGQTANGQIPFTDFTFAIQQVIYDPHQMATGKTLLIHQTGGIVNGQTVSISDDPLFKVGEHDVLFLHQYSPGHFFVEGGPSGRFVVRNGLVSPISGEGVKLSGSVTEADFIAQIQQA